MPRIIAIDYGGKRTGLATTDPLKIIASALDAIPSEQVIAYLQNYTKTEAVEAIVVGYPKGLDGKPTDGTKLVENFVEKLKTAFPEMPIHLHDERFTSRMAVQTMVTGGMKKKNRQVKGNVDKISAVIILQSFLGMSFY